MKILGGLFGLLLRNQKWLKLFSALYVVLLLLSHSILPHAHVWAIACVFSIVMNFVYISAAFKVGRYRKIEALVATILIVFSICGVFLAPLFVISAIAMHGLWDILKHFGKGVPFLSWYTLGCAGVDFLYACVLLAYWLQWT